MQIFKLRYMKEYLALKEKDDFFVHKVVNDIADLSSIVNQYLDGNYIFRGANEAKYMLYSSAQRKITCVDEKSFKDEIYSRIEKVRKSSDIISYFKSLNVPINDILILGLLQHFGSPSPLLDFTHDINTAMFFALDGLKYSATEDINDYFSIYIVDKRIPDFCSLQQVMLNGAQRIQNMLEESTYSREQIDAGDVLSDFKELRYSQLEPISRILILGSKEGKVDIDIPFFDFKCSYNITNPNLESQIGLFILNNTREVPLEKLVKEELSCYPPQIMCIDIHKSLSEEIEKQYVLSKGIDRNTIYPQNSDTSNITNWLMEIGLL